jgi:hypothetical protein
VFDIYFENIFKSLTRINQKIEKSLSGSIISLSHIPQLSVLNNLSTLDPYPL